MSGSNDDRRSRMLSAPSMHGEVVLSDSFEDLLVPGVMVELDGAEAEALGAFEEVALSETDAWEANADLDADEARDGR
jgi:hypothetical protein